MVSLRVKKIAPLVALPLTGLLLVSGCGAAGSSGANSAGGSDEGEISGTVTVLAAASLTESFGQIEADFEAANPDVDVVVSYAGSSALATQINEGAPADVFASASPNQMDSVASEGLVDGEAQVFVQNRLVIAVPEGNPDGVEGLSQLENLSVAVCAEQVPCGAATATAFAEANIDFEATTYESNVKSTLSKLLLGEVDAALVYQTDALVNDEEVDAIEFPEADSAINDYPIATLKDAPNPIAGQAFVEYVLAQEGQKVLDSFGFDIPDAS